MPGPRKGRNMIGEEAYSILNSLPLPVVIFAREGRILFSNHQFRSFLKDRFQFIEDLEGHSLFDHLLEGEIMKGINYLLKYGGKGEYPIHLRKGEGDGGPSFERALLSHHGEDRFLLTLCPFSYLHNIPESPGYGDVEDELRRKNWELTLMNDLLYLMNRSFSVERMLSLSLNLLITRMDFDMGTIRLIEGEEWGDGEGGIPLGLYEPLSIHADETVEEILREEEPQRYLRVVVSRGIPDNILKKDGRIKLDDSTVAGRVALTGRVFYTTEGFSDFKIVKNCRSGIVIPLKARGKIHGILFLGKKEKRAFSRSENLFFTQLGTQMGMVIENASLFHNLNTTYRELLSTQDRLILREKLAAIGELSARIAHEIRNPLTAISNSLSIIEKEMERAGIEGNRFISIIFEEVERLEKILKDFLYFSRFTPVWRRQADIVDLVKGTLFVLLQDRRWSSRIKLVQDLPEDLGPVHTDPERFREILWNLLSNSLDAVSTDRGRITIRLRKMERGGRNILELKVRDNGKGIREEIREKVFEPFFTTRPRGTGLGLSIVKRAVQDLGGSITFRSKSGVSTEFSVRLPCDREVSD